MLTGLRRFVKIEKIKLQRKNVLFGEKANIDRNAKFEGQNKVGAQSWFEGYMGYGTYIGDNCEIKARIGRFCSIGHKVSVLTGNHPSHGFVSTSPMFFSLGLQNGATFVNKQKFQERVYVDEENHYGVIIGNDVWIGYSATLMGGVNVGDGAIIAAGALVRDDVKPYTIVAGQPAVEIGKRFTDDQIAWLITHKWWDKPLDWIKKHADWYDDIDKFIELNDREEKNRDFK